MHAASLLELAAPSSLFTFVVMKLAVRTSSCLISPPPLLRAPPSDPWLPFFQVSPQRASFPVGRRAALLLPALLSRSFSPFSTDFARDGLGSASKRRVRGPVMATKEASKDVHHQMSGVIKSPTWSRWLKPKNKANQPLLSLGRRITTFSFSPQNALTNKEKVIVISGPTGAGKSRLALELAKKLDGEIISADSVQVYRGLDIGSAKPSISDRNEVPHHLIDILHPSEDYSAGQFFDDARKATRDVLDKGRVPIVAGGTGLYLRWYVYGKPDVPKASMDITSEVWSDLMDLQKNGQWDLAVELVVKAGDPKAQNMPLNDWYRLRRSLEIIRSSGSPPSAFNLPYNAGEFSAKDLDYDFICVFLASPRIDLYRSIDLRCEQMLVDLNGLLTESSWLLDLGLRPSINSATRAIGYRQAMEFLLNCRQRGGRGSSEELLLFLSEFQKASRNFAKRQVTWFRNEAIYQWVDASRPSMEVIDFIYDAYRDDDGRRVVPESIRMERESSGRQESYELKSYRAENGIFLGEEDCQGILNWIQRTQLQ